VWKSSTTKKRRSQITEVALPGGGRHRNSYGKGKGASPVGVDRESTPAMEFFQRK